MLTEKDKINNILDSMNRDEVDNIKDYLKSIKPFAPEESFYIGEKCRAVMVEQVRWALGDIFENIMKIDLNDHNIKDTPARIASMWINELFIGRYTEKPRLESFDIKPYMLNSEGLIIKKNSFVSMCSHHFMPFFTDSKNDESVCLIAYKPTKKFLGISKIGRLLNWYARRPQLQETLSFQIYKDLCEILESEDVLVFMKNITHTCEALRGFEDNCANTSTLYYGGIFKEDSQLRNQVMYV